MQHNKYKLDIFDTHKFGKMIKNPSGYVVVEKSIEQFSV